MKTKRNINKKTILPLLGLVLLLILSPCKVRNFIQEKLDIPQTEVSNKSKVIISQSNCNTLNIFENNFVKEKKFSQASAVIIADYQSPFSVADYNSTQPQIIKNRNFSVSIIPLYILYKNFKDYL